MVPVDIESPPAKALSEEFGHVSPGAQELTVEADMPSTAMVHSLHSTAAGSSRRCQVIPGPVTVKFIVVAEACERFCFYSLRAVLTIFMVDKLHISENVAVSAFLAFSSLAYISPVIGGAIADLYWGRFRTIAVSCAVYLAGMLLLGFTSLSAVMWGTVCGLLLIALGTGGVKANVAVYGAQQLRGGDEADEADGEQDEAAAAEREAETAKYFSVFYFAVNTGSITSYIIAPAARTNLGFAAVFFICASMLLAATVTFVLPRKRYIDVQPGGSALATVWRVYKDAAAAHGGWCSACARGVARPCAKCCCRRCRGDEAHHALAQPSPAYGATPGQDSPQLQSRLRSSSEHDTSGSDTAPSPLALTGRNSRPSSRGASYDEVPSDSRASPFVHPHGTHWLDAARSSNSEEAVAGAKALWRLSPMLLALCMFWACFDQQGSSWVLQAKHMDLHGLHPDNVGLLNPLLVMLYIPLLTAWVFPATDRALQRLGLGRLTALRKMAVGMWITGLSFIAAAMVQGAMDASDTPISAVALLPQYCLITLSEVLVSTTGLEWMYTQAPPALRGSVMAMWYLTTALGDSLAGGIYSGAENLPKQALFWLFAIATCVAAAAFMWLAKLYVPANWKKPASR